MAGPPATMIAILGPCLVAAAQLAGRIGGLDRGWQPVCHPVSGELPPHLGAEPPHLAIICHGEQLPVVEHWLPSLRLRHATLPILLHGDSPAGSLLIPCLMAGACGWLDQSASPAELELAVAEALAGGTPLSLKARNRLRQYLQQAWSRAATLWHLTTRERHILACLVHHSTDKDIAQALNLSSGTVHAHLAHIYAKLEVHTRQEAIAKWLAISS